MASQPGYTIEEVPENVTAFPSSKVGQTAAVQGIIIGLKALSQGAAIALSNVASHLFSLLTVASAFWLWLTFPEPNTNQLISIGGYALFILAANVIVRRK